MDCCWLEQSNIDLLLVLCNHNFMLLLQDDYLIKKFKIDLTIISFSALKLNSSLGVLKEHGMLHVEAAESADLIKQNIDKAQITVVRPLRKGFIFMTDNFYFCSCNLHRISKNKELLSNGIYYVTQGYYLQVDHLNDSYIYTASTNQNGSFQTIV